MPRSIRVGNTTYTTVSNISAEIEPPQPQSSSTRVTTQTEPYAPRFSLDQAEIDRILASYGRLTTATNERRTTQQPLDFDPNNLTISERVGLNDMGVYRPRHYKRTGGLT